MALLGPHAGVRDSDSAVRYLAEQVYYLYPSPSAKVVGAWEPYVKNYMPNIGNDYGGRMMAAWPDK